MYNLAAGLAVAFVLSTVIFLFLFLRLASGLKKAVYIPWCDIVAMFHSYHHLGNISRADVYINGNIVKSTSLIMVPKLIALSIASAEGMKPKKIVIKEKVEKKFSHDPIIYSEAEIIYAE
jgi:hypothetical protein